jgi:hypothetical protein
MNNTEKLDGVKRTLRRIETQVGIIQRINIIMFERITGRAFPPNWIIHEDERAILSENGPVTLNQPSNQLEEHPDATAESLESLTERITRIEKQLAIGKDETLSPAGENQGNPNDAIRSVASPSAPHT